MSTGKSSLLGLFAGLDELLSDCSFFGERTDPKLIFMFNKFRKSAIPLFLYKTIEFDVITVFIIANSTINVKLINGD